MRANGKCHVAIGLSKKNSGKGNLGATGWSTMYRGDIKTTEHAEYT